jgi:hypothetical protein
MPDPMVMPTTSATELHRPSVRGSLSGEELSMADRSMLAVDG